MYATFTVVRDDGTVLVKQSGQLRPGAKIKWVADISDPIIDEQGNALKKIELEPTYEEATSVPRRVPET